MVAWSLKCKYLELDFHKLHRNFQNDLEHIYLVYKTYFLYHQNAHFILLDDRVLIFQVYIIILFF